jgi:acylphosphatase
MPHLQIQVWGRVQGVGFRRFVYDQANGLRLTGYVENLPNGSVAVEVVGEPTRLDKFLGIIKDGSRFSHVNRMEVSDISPPLEFDGFEIRK